MRMRNGAMDPRPEPEPTSLPGPDLCSALVSPRVATRWRERSGRLQHHGQGTVTAVLADAYACHAWRMRVPLAHASAAASCCAQTTPPAAAIDRLSDSVCCTTCSYRSCKAAALSFFATTSSRRFS